MRYLVVFLFLAQAVSAATYTFGDEELKLRYRNGKFQIYSYIAGGRAEKVHHEFSGRPSPQLSLALEKINFGIQNQMVKRAEKFDEASLMMLAQTIAPAASSNPLYLKRMEEQYLHCDMDRLNRAAAEALPPREGRDRR